MVDARHNGDRFITIDYLNIHYTMTVVVSKDGTRKKSTSVLINEELYLWGKKNGIVFSKLIEEEIIKLKEKSDVY